MDLLFDEHCAGNYFSNQAEIDQNHKSICVGHHADLPAGMTDDAIMEYAKNNNFTNKLGPKQFLFWWYIPCGTTA
jgi:hypothetical protein